MIMIVRLVSEADFARSFTARLFFRNMRTNTGRLWLNVESLVAGGHRSTPSSRLSHRYRVWNDAGPEQGVADRDGV